MNESIEPTGSKPIVFSRLKTALIFVVLALCCYFAGRAHESRKWKAETIQLRGQLSDAQAIILSLEGLFTNHFNAH